MKNNLLFNIIAINKKETKEQLQIMFLACFKDTSLFKYALLTIKLVVGVPHKKLIKNKHKDFLFSKSLNLLNRLNKKLFTKFKLNNKLLKTYIGIIPTTTL
jgi:hypothetical protein